MSSTPANLLATMALNADIDVRQVLPAIRVPTLVLHGTEDLAVSPQNARQLAEQIPGAELILLEGAGHLYLSEQAEAVDAAVLDFVRRHERA